MFLRMSGATLSSFLRKAKQSLADSLESKGQHHASFVIGNQSADLDSICSALVYGYIQSHTPSALKAGKVTIPITNIPAEETKLRPELTALLKHADLTPSDLITLDDLGDFSASLPPGKTDWTLVDHNVLLGEVGEIYAESVVGVIDHHDSEGTIRSDAEPNIIESAGSCASLVTEYCRSAWESLSHNQSSSSNTAAETTELDAQLAYLALGPILIDTVNLQAKDKITPSDTSALSYLEDRIFRVHKTYDRETFFRELDTAKSDLDSLSLEEILRKDYKSWDESGLSLGISSAVRSMDYLISKSKTSHFVEELLSFAKKREVDLFAIMTAHNEGEDFAREILLIAMASGKPQTAAERFSSSNSETLRLEELTNQGVDGSKAVFFRLWRQKDTNSSRKQVAPMLREAMKG